MLHVDLGQRKVVAPQSEMSTRAERLVAAHATLPAPDRLMLNP